MKRIALLSVTCIMLLSVLSACDVITALEITPSPSPFLSPTPEPTTEPTFEPTPVPTPEPTPVPTLKPTPTLLPTPKPDVHSLPGDTVIKFQDQGVEKLIRKLLILPERDITVAEMRKITSFDYNPDVYSFANEKIYSLEDLRYCENLEYLYITGNRVSDLSPLAEMKSLQSIWIGGNPVTDASAVLALPSLQDFNALHTGITDISALSATKNLRTFYCDSQFSDITPLFAHKNLWQVLLIGINDDSFRALLSNCTGIGSIRIRDADLKNESLALFKGRSYFAIDLENCGITDISTLKGVADIEDLRFTDNSIEDISVLKNIKISRYLDLRGNRIRDWSPLKGMKGLSQLLITGNPVTESNVLDDLEKGGCKITR